MAATAVASNTTADGLVGQFNEIRSFFLRLSPQRLIIVGGAGAGKTVLVMRLARDLLAAKHPLLIAQAVVWIKPQISEWFTMSLEVFTGDEASIARDDKVASEHGWQIKVGPNGLRTYRDPRFNQLSSQGNAEDGPPDTPNA